MQLEALEFHLPEPLIAPFPLRQKDQARLLYLRAPGRYPAICDLKVLDLVTLLNPGDLLVFNDTRVIPSQVLGQVRARPISLTLYQSPDRANWQALARPAKRIRCGDRITLDSETSLQVLSFHPEGSTVRWSDSTSFPLEWLRKHGRPPLPSYLKRPAQPSDWQDYQTIFANADGAVAAPTASLHFTPALLKLLSRHRIEHTTVTLHVGPGTFRPIRSKTLQEHTMQPEWGQISPATANKINTAKAASQRVIAVGTTVLRLLETALGPDGTVTPFRGQTGLYITPGYQIGSADLLLTNFHQPRSTPLALAAAFAGLSPILAAYEHAKTMGYRFYSYGDCCLLENASLQAQPTPA